jgi:hypothetical protein
MNRKLMVRVVILMATIAIAPVARAQVAGNIIAYPEANPTTCGVTDAGGAVEVHLIHSGHDGVTGSEFALDVSDPGWTHLADSWAVGALGLSTTGVTLIYGSCDLAAVYLGSITYLGTSAPCSQILFAPTPAAVSLDCGASPIAFGSNFVGSVNCPCGVEPPYNMMPTDGAVGVSLSPTLSWSWDAPIGCPEGIGLTISTVFMGTDPGSLTEVGWIDWNSPPFSLNVGPLAPLTTYYWRIDVDDFYWLCAENEASSAVQSFTTDGPVATESGTWGLIKALYR